MFFEKAECCPKCQADGEDWHYDGQTCQNCGYGLKVEPPALNGPYLLFSGMTYYPSGGWEDFKGSFATYDAALRRYAKMHKDDDWYQIVHLAVPVQVLKGGAR